VSVIKRYETQCHDVAALKLLAEKKGWHCHMMGTEQQPQLSLSSPRGGHVTVQCYKGGELLVDSDYLARNEVFKSLRHPIHRDRPSDEYNACLVQSRYPELQLTALGDGSFVGELDVEAPGAEERELVTE
jgi:hypothetical protein